MQAAPAGANTKGWKASGSGEVGGTTDRWQWVARSDVGSSGTGAPATGHFEEYDSATDTGFSAVVTCLNVAGNTARIGILICESTNLSRPAGSWTYITMRTMKSMGGAVNTVGADGVFLGLAPTICPAPSGYIIPFDGTITIQG